MSVKRDNDRDGEVSEAALAFTLTEPISPALLDEELGGLGLVTEGSPAQASSNSPVTMWVVEPGDVSVQKILAKVKAHEVSAEPEDLLGALRDKVQSGEDLSPTEVQDALRELLLRA